MNLYCVCVCVVIPRAFIEPDMAVLTSGRVPVWVWVSGSWLCVQRWLPWEVGSRGTILASTSVWRKQIIITFSSRLVIQRKIVLDLGENILHVSAKQKKYLLASLLTLGI